LPKIPRQGTRGIKGHSKVPKGLFGYGRLHRYPMKIRVNIKNTIDIFSLNPKLIAVMNDISKKSHAYISFEPLLICKRINPSLAPYSYS